MKYTNLVVLAALLMVDSVEALRLQHTHQNKNAELV